MLLNVFICLLIIIVPCFSLETESEFADLVSFNMEVVSCVNEKRKMHGSPELKLNTELILKGTFL